MVLYHADVHDVHNVRVTLKRKVIPEVRIMGSIASHAYDLLDNIRTKLRVIAHKLCGEDDSTVIVTVTQSVTESVSDESRKRGEHGIFIFHSVTSELESLKKEIQFCCEALKKTKKNFVVIAPNNDPGCEIIFKTIGNNEFLKKGSAINKIDILFNKIEKEND